MFTEINIRTGLFYFFDYRSSDFGHRWFRRFNLFSPMIHNLARGGTKYPAFKFQSAIITIYHMSTIIPPSLPKVNNQFTFGNKQTPCFQNFGAGAGNFWNFRGFWKMGGGNLYEFKGGLKNHWVPVRQSEGYAFSRVYIRGCIVLLY